MDRRAPAAAGALEVAVELLADGAESEAVRGALRAVPSFDRSAPTQSVRETDEGVRVTAADYPRLEMKVLEGLKAIEPGTSVPVADLGLPITGAKGLLLVFWKST